MPAAPLVALDEDEFEALVPGFTTGPVRAEAANLFLPGDIVLTGATASPAAQDRYLAVCLRRMEGLGVKVLVFGSGRARAIPDGADRASALDQIEDFMRRAAARAAEHGVRLVLEPLRRQESNVFNSVREGAAFLRERHIEGFRLLADLYHMMDEGEDLGAIDDAADLLWHAHVADGAARRAPGEGDYDIAAFLAHLHQSGYRGDVSIECGWDDFDREIGPALSALRSAGAGR
ncbi:MAG: sugar phosphate isomerase/epimerase family protein [Candidatus Dormibacteraceae bacterium]